MGRRGGALLRGVLGCQEVNYSCCWLVISSVGGTGWKMGVGDAPSDLQGSARGCPKNGNDRDTRGQKGSPGHPGRPPACTYQTSRSSSQDSALFRPEPHTVIVQGQHTALTLALTHGAHTRTSRTTSTLASALNRSEFSKQLPTIRRYGFQGSQRRCQRKFNNSHKGKLHISNLSSLKSTLVFRNTSRFNTTQSGTDNKMLVNITSKYYKIPNA